ncbi:MAG: hypothetical protein AAFR90_13215 [Pseudomonadota bacterium]
MARSRASSKFNLVFGFRLIRRAQADAQKLAVPGEAFSKFDIVNALGDLRLSCRRST